MITTNKNKPREVAQRPPTRILTTSMKEAKQRFATDYSQGPFETNLTYKGPLISTMTLEENKRKAERAKVAASKKAAQAKSPKRGSRKKAKE